MTHRMADVKGKTALVTGSTSGIGQATAVALAGPSNAATEAEFDESW
jgi:NAD(P)-dependent dehydrogenase (short-subunit alcohol dehydrogenase family)